jgi:hypothetical protein
LVIYWTLNSIPELAGLSKEERQKIWQAAYWKTFRHWQTWLALLAPGICATLLSALVVGGRSLLWGMLGGAIGGGIFGYVAMHTALPYVQEELAARKTRLDVPTITPTDRASG